MFKKVVVADNLSTFVDNIYNVTTRGPAVLWVGIIFFAIQIYCDFSGYSDIAIGAADIMGFKLIRVTSTRPIMRLRSPISGAAGIYRSQPGSATTYIYPLGGNRVTKPRWV